MRKNLSFTLSILLLLITISHPLAGAAAASPPVRLTFDKTLVASGLWQGTAGGDISGGLRTELKELRITGAIWHVEFDFIVDAGVSSFTTRLKGILNTKTGKVVMNGIVTEGYFEGAQVHEEARLVDPDPGVLRFVGTIRIMPETAE